MIYFIIGTKAQLIKMAPVIKVAEKKAIPFRLILTGQHRNTIKDIADNFELRAPDYTLYDGPDVISIPAMLVWAAKVLWKTYRYKEDVFSVNDNGIVLVHGDTFSTLIGALMAKIAGLPVGHVESGLRSFNLFHPFPEEITRLLVFRLADVYFCPGEWAMTNVEKFQGRKINTYKNTLYDSLRYALASQENISVQVPDRVYGIVSLHRFENIRSRFLLLRIVEIIEYIARDHFLLFILHKPTENKLRNFLLLERLEQNKNIELRDRYDYFGFMKLVVNSIFMISDGGSNQEECAYLGKPVLLLRKATEREDGLDSNCVLSNYEDSNIERFLREFPAMTGGALSELQDTISPSEIVVDSCKAL